MEITTSYKTKHAHNLWGLNEGILNSKEGGKSNKAV